jgi:hypothetical protein
LSGVKQEETTIIFSNYLDRFLGFFAGLSEDFFVKQPDKPQVTKDLAPQLRDFFVNNPLEVLPVMLEFFALKLPETEQDKLLAWLKTKFFEVFSNVFLKHKDNSSLQGLCCMNPT